MKKVIALLLALMMMVGRVRIWNMIERTGLRGFAAEARSAQMVKKVIAKATNKYAKKSCLNS